MLALLDYQNQAIHAIGGQPDSRITLTQVVNEALAYLFNSHPWSWRGRPPLPLTAVIGQQYLALPADFGELVAISRPNREVQLTSIQDLSFRRNLTLVPPPIGTVFMALSYPAQSSVTTEAPVPQLEIFPTPTAADTYVMNYRAGALLLANPTDVPNIPPEFERLLSLLCRAFIRDYEEQSSTTEWERATEEVEKLKVHDGLAQQNLGQIKGGAVDDPSLRVNFSVSGVTSRV